MAGLYLAKVCVTNPIAISPIPASPNSSGTLTLKYPSRPNIGKRSSGQVPYYPFLRRWGVIVHEQLLPIVNHLVVFT